MDESQGKVALLAGASGLVGTKLLETLLSAPDFGRIYAVTRRPLGREHARIANRIVQFDQLEIQLRGLSCHTAFCCLGASPADSAALQRTTELEYVLAFARVARSGGAQRLVFLSCGGAEPQAKDARLRLKAEAERALEGLAFPALDIIKPGALLGLRREVRIADLARFITVPLMNPLLTGSREAQRGISAAVVADAMLGAARSGRRGVYRYTYSSLRALASLKPQTPKPPSGAPVPKSGRST